MGPSTFFAVQLFQIWKTAEHERPEVREQHDIVVRTLDLERCKLGHLMHGVKEKKGGIAATSYNCKHATVHLMHSHGYSNNYAVSCTCIHEAVLKTLLREGSELGERIKATVIYGQLAQ